MQSPFRRDTPPHRTPALAFALLLCAPWIARADAPPVPAPAASPAVAPDAVPDAAPVTEPPADAPPPAPGVPFNGRALRRGDRVAMPGVTVILDSTDEVVTDAQGRFGWSSLPPGKHTLDFRSPKIVAAHAEETLRLGKKLDVTYYLNAKDRYTTVVKSQRAVKETVETELSMEEIKHIAGTQGDALKSVQNLPGVARSAFGLGQLIVWGSNPQDTRVYIDGVYIPTLFHFGGLRSTVQSDMLANLNFLPGGYGVDFGRGLGGVVDVESRKPRSDGYHGFLQLDLIDGSLMLEGPIPGTKNVTFAIAARRSWLDVFLPLFTPNNFQLSPQYTDYQAQLDWRITSHDDLRFFLFGSDDSIALVAKNSVDPTLSAAFDSHTDYHRLLARYTHRFDDGATLTLTPYGGYENPANISINFGNRDLTLTSEIWSYGLRAVARVPVTRFLRVDTGVDFEGTHYTATVTGNLAALFGAGNDVFSLFQNHVAPFVSAKFSFFDNKLVLNPQLRLDVYTFIGSDAVAHDFSSAFINPEPRLAMRWQMSSVVALKGSVGLYHQPPDPTSFSGVGGNPKLQPEASNHYVLGLDIDPFPFLHAELIGFYKDLSNLVVGGERITNPALVNDGIGRIYGGEILVRLEPWKNLFGWVSYTLSRSERKDHADEDWHVFQFDQTHILTILGSYKLPRGFQVGLRFRYVTGNPETPIIGAYYNGLSGRYTPVYGPTNSARVGAFNQLDVRFDKTFTFDLWKLSIYLDIQNVYNASNPEGTTYSYNYQQSASISGLPFLPVFGIRGEF